MYSKLSWTICCHVQYIVMYNMLSCTVLSDCFHRFWDHVKAWEWLYYSTYSTYMIVHTSIYPLYITVYCTMRCTAMYVGRFSLSLVISFCSPLSSSSRFVLTHAYYFLSPSPPSPTSPPTFSSLSSPCKWYWRVRGSRLYWCGPTPSGGLSLSTFNWLLLSPKSGSLWVPSNPQETLQDLARPPPGLGRHIKALLDPSGSQEAHQGLKRCPTGLRRHIQASLLPPQTPGDASRLH